MPVTSYLAFDLGASSGRAVLGMLDGAVMRMEELHRFTTPIVERDQHLFWDVGALWDELQTGLLKALDAAPDLRSLSVDSWAVDYVPLGDEGEALRLPYCYRDPRTGGVMERAFDTLSAEAIYRHTGIQFLPFNTLYQVLADRADDSGALRRVRTHLLIADYFNYRFSGRLAVEASMASTTQLVDVRTQQWSGDMFEAFGLDPGQWPEIVPAGSRLGMARQAPEVSVVASCSHDTANAVAATPAAQETGWAYVSCGTWSLLGTERTEPVLTDEARAAGFTHEAGLDGTIRFLKNLTGLWALQECAREWDVTDWAALEAEAAAADPPRTPIDLEDPRFLPRGEMETRIRDYCREHERPVPESRGQVARLILGSIADSYRRAVGDLERVTGEAISTLHLVGGGSQNDLLCRLTADACGIRVVAGPAEATALGNLLIQARTLGDLPDGLTIRDVALRSSDLRDYLPTSQPRPHGTPDR
jgi:rhamnulokinase